MDVIEYSLKNEIELLQKLGFDHPTEIQTQSMPRLAQGESLFGLAPTGSGKTLAFLIPLMSKLDPALRKVQMLVLSPTRELGLQTFQVAEKLSQLLASENSKTHLMVRTAFGGQRTDSQKEEILKNPAVLIATPGRVLEYLERGLIELDELKSIVLDEADLMVGMGFEPQVSRICDFLPRKYQSALFSATESESQSRLQNRLAHRATRVDVRAKKSEEVQSSEKLDSFVHQYFTYNERQDKASALVNLLNSIQAKADSGIVFCQTRETVHSVVQLLKHAGLSAEALSGELGQVERTTVLRRFKSGGLKFLVATNLASRGIDVKELGVVVNYDLPSTSDEYIHRVGRSGRAGLSGWAVSLCSRQSLQFLRETLSPVGISVEKLIHSSSAENSGIELDKAQPELKEAIVSPTSFKKIHINRGKSSKIRPGDIVGALTKDIGLKTHQIGGIFIFDHFSHVEIEDTLFRNTISHLNNRKIKNLPIKASEADTLTAARFQPRR